MMPGHVPVLFKETIDALQLKPGATVIDLTLGGGGHAARALELIGPTGHLIGFDQDSAAIERVQERFKAQQNITYIHANFSELAQNVHEPVDAIMMDCGVSSYQLDILERGFAWKENSPLDMRMDQRQALTAADLLRTLSETELADIIYQYGEERFSRQIAASIVELRKTTPFLMSDQLRDVVFRRAKGGFVQKRTSVSRVFQALRIAVNRELDVLTAGLEQAIELLKPGGRIAIISFHSLEDRIVKQTFKAAAMQQKITLVVKKPIVPTDEECGLNSRSRSAKLRIGERL